MLLDDVAHPDALLRMERYVDEGTQTYSPFAAQTDVAPEFRPRGRARSFEAVAVRVPRDRVSVLTSDADEQLLARYVRETEVVLVVHPETWRSPDVEGIELLQTFPRAAPIRVAPTASTRTVLALDGAPPHFLKLHYPKRVSRFNRRLRVKNIQTGVAVTGDVAELKHDRFAFLPEAIGVVLRDVPHPWGYLVRGARPRPEILDRFLVPFFALYGGDLDHADHPTLLAQMIERHAVDATSFLIDELVTPIVECWCAAANRGILLESHAQNVLLEVDATLRPKRIVHRDFDVWIDAKARAAAHLPELAGALIEADSEHERRMHYSLVFDHFVGRELLDYLLATAARSFVIDERRVREHVASVLHAQLHDADERFPKETTYYFSSEILPENRFRLVDTHEKPRWR